MKRTVIKINDELCDGCGKCVGGCHEGALQLINGKAVMINDLYCDGLGACIGECPVGAISFQEREAEPYDERAVMERLLPKGTGAVTAHLKHLKEHGENKWLGEGLEYLRSNGVRIGLPSADDKILPCGCPGSAAMVIDRPAAKSDQVQQAAPQKSELAHFPLQLSLINPNAEFFRGTDLLLAADCTAFACGVFHSLLLKGKTLAVACPKLDGTLDTYSEKLVRLIDQSRISTLTVAVMEVPCCRGLIRIAKDALGKAGRKIPLKVTVVSVNGDVIKEEWA